jgi:DTW domain-containing protein
MGRLLLEDPKLEPRPRCWQCRKARVCCYCSDLEAFESHPRFVILIHPLEAKHPVGTGRMAHQSLSNSVLWQGQNFSDFAPLNHLLSDPKIFPVLLFPGEGSLNITEAPAHQQLLNAKTGDRELVVIVLDATWTLAKKMLRQTPALQALPKISFTPTKISGFVVRKQPASYCYSTIEAIHEVLRLLDSADHSIRQRESLMYVFTKMVARQVAYQEARPEGRSRHARNYLLRKGREKGQVSSPE